MQAICAACEPVKLVGQLQQQQRNTERDHQPGQVTAAQHGQAAQPTQQGRHTDGDCQANQWIRHHELGEQRRRVGSHTEKRRMSKRHNAAVTQHEVE